MLISPVDERRWLVLNPAQYSLARLDLTVTGQTRPTEQIIEEMASAWQRTDAARARAQGRFADATGTFDAWSAHRPEDRRYHVPQGG